MKIVKFETKLAADKLVEKIKNPANDEYFMSDKELGVLFKLKPAMVKKIREALEIPIKEDRVIRVLRSIPTATMFIPTISLALKDKIPYNSLYVLMRNNNIPFQRKNKISWVQSTSEEVAEENTTAEQEMLGVLFQEGAEHEQE